MEQQEVQAELCKHTETNTLMSSGHAEIEKKNLILSQLLRSQISLNYKLIFKCSGMLIAKETSFYWQRNCVFIN